MRLFSDAFRAVAALGLSLALAGCGTAAEGDRPSGAEGSPLPARAIGPAADYPMVLGDPFTIDGVEYTPTDTMNYDEVGYLAAEGEAGAGVTAAHKILPLPSYVEVTSLETGRTILARVERRGPMTNKRVIALSPDALAQLGAGEGAPVRVRRVNPPEAQRAHLRAGETVPLRMDTPETLLRVMRRRLSKEGPVSLADSRKPPVPSGIRTANEPALPPPPATQDEPAPPTATPEPTGSKSTEREPLGEAPAETSTGAFFVQAATFASKANAERAAAALDGFILEAGRFYRVRTGPYPTRGQAEAALAKVRDAGYSDARVSTTD